MTLSEKTLHDASASDRQAKSALTRRVKGSEEYKAMSSADQDTLLKNRIEDLLQERFDDWKSCK